MKLRSRNKRRRVERQEQATARQATYDGLSLETKLVRADGAREVARLTRALQAVRLA